MQRRGGQEVEPPRRSGGRPRSKAPAARGTQYAALAKGEADEEEEDDYGAFVTR